MSVSFSRSSREPVWKLPLVYFDGNSLTRGQGAAVGSDYPSQCMRLLSNQQAIEGHNVGVDGVNILQMIASAPSVVDPAGAPDWRRPRKIVVGWEGRNDLETFDSASVSYGHMVTYYQARLAAGFQNVVVTALPSDQGGTLPDYETIRLAYNASLRANWTQYGSALADVGADPTLGQVTSPDNLTYFFDHLHLTAAGYAIVAQIVATALLPLIVPPWP